MKALGRLKGKKFYQKKNGKKIMKIGFCVSETIPAVTEGRKTDKLNIRTP